ncbi:Uncharacterised protein [Mycobacteroides abscessus subsp. abscessus]|nr:Uncharacterised protein [Mycobacteroides abscessus subsp. abscessus]
MRRVPCAVATTSPPSRSTRRCCETAWRVIGSDSASSPTDEGLRASRSKIARRVGSPRIARSTSLKAATFVSIGFQKLPGKGVGM